MKKIVISGSAKLQQELKKWNQWWINTGFEVLYCPDLISPQVDFPTAYRATYKGFYTALLKSDMLFLMNEDKNGIEGYIGAQTFAEASYAVANNLVFENKKIQVVILKKPSDKVACHTEVMTWLELDWAILFDDWKKQEGL